LFNINFTWFVERFVGRVGVGVGVGCWVECWVVEMLGLGLGVGVSNFVLEFNSVYETNSCLFYFIVGKIKNILKVFMF
jgi:hypothetical protein